MKFYNNFKVSKNHKKSIILIGNFDGLHSGHKKLFKLAQIYKKKFKLKIGVITFEPMPKIYYIFVKIHFRHWFKSYNTNF